MKIFSKIKNYIHNPKIFKRVILNQFAPLIKNDEFFLKMKWRISDMQYPLNLENPQTYCEKLQWLKLHNRKPIYTTMVDKAEAKKYVASIIGEEYIIPTIAIWDSADKIDWDILPNQFVMKCTHDSGGIVICKDKSKLDKFEAYKIMKKGLKRRYFWQNREWPYKDVTPRIIVEEYLEDIKTRELRDYKFFCFDGSVKALFIASERQKRGEETKFDFFDDNFNHLPIINGHPNARLLPEIPSHYEEMKTLAAKLSKGLPHLRVDFYEMNGKIYFGELTFFHWSGMVPFEPVEWDYKFGEWIILPSEIK